MCNNYVCIMAGGVGTRFWPYSRQKYPKQFIQLLNTNESLLQTTVKKFLNVVPVENIFILTNANYKDLVLTQLPDIKEEHVFLEPVMRNTAPSIAFAAYKIKEKNPKANLVFSPADHFIEDEHAFAAAIRKGLDFSSSDNTVAVLGIKPTSPHTGYGYIQFNKNEIRQSLLKVKSFTEKPKEDMAKMFINSGDFFWNAGIFFWNVETIIKAFNQFSYEVASLFNEITPYFFTNQENKQAERAFHASPNISIDYAIMEKMVSTQGTNVFDVYVLPCDFTWSDLGAWNALFNIRQKDKHNNVLDDNVITYDTQNCIIKTPKDRLVILNGLEDFIVVEHDNVLLISRRKDEQKLKQFYQDAKKRNSKFS